MIRVLHLQGPSNWGGNLEGILTLFKALDRNRFHPIMGGTESSGYLQRFYDEGFDTIDIPLRGRWDFKGLHRLNQTLRRERIDLLHTHVRMADWLGGISSKWVGVPSVCTLHAPFQYTGDMQPLRDGTLPVYGWVLRNLTDAVITVSNALRKDAVRLLRLPSDEVSHVVNGIDPGCFGDVRNRKSVREELNIPLDAPLLIQVGWFGYRKGHRDLIAALPGVKEVFPEVRCLMVGDGDLRARCEAQVRELGLEGSVLFLGFRDDVGDLMSASDLLVLPTYSEGLPRVLLEAYILGKPVVSTRVDGVLELVEDGVTGLLVESGDVSGLVNTIIHIISDRNVAHAMGELGRKIVLGKFSSERMARATEDVYCRVLAKRRVSVPGYDRVAQ